jgi:hypothetical protein
MNPLSAMLIPIAVLSVVCVLTLGKIIMDGVNWYRVMVLLLSSAGSAAGTWLLATANRTKRAS